MKNEVRGWLEEGDVDVFLGYKMVDGHPLPHAFARDSLEEMDELIIGPAYPLEKIALRLTAEYPDIKIGMLARDSDLRALNVLCIWNQLSPDRVKTLNVNSCPSDVKEHGDSSYLEPQDSGPYKKQVGIDNNMGTEEVEAYGQQERFARWMYEFQKCIKCYGCRNICPVCFCKECGLQHPNLVGTGELPVEVPIFHMVRAVHMAGRCIDCGLCEEVCPVGIPLRLLYRKVNQIVTDVFDYETGITPSQPPFSVLGENVTLEPKPIKAPELPSD